MTFTFCNFVRRWVWLAATTFILLVTFAYDGHSTVAARSGVQANKAAGNAWETELMKDALPKTQKNVQPQITIQSSGPSGLRVSLDAVGTDAGGAIRLPDGKASASAPLTPNQTVVYPELPVYGGKIVGQGKEPFTRGTVIPPTRVDIIRKP